MEAQRRYEQAAEFAATDTDRMDYLRLAAGAAANRFVGDETLRLLRTAGDIARPIGDDGGAARDLAIMAMYIRRAPGIMAERHSPAEARALLDEARAISVGSPAAEAAIAVATTTVAGRQSIARTERSSSPSKPVTASWRVPPWTG